MKGRNFGKAAFTELLHLSIEVLSLRRRNFRKLYYQQQNWNTLHNLYSIPILTIHNTGSLELNEIVLVNHPGKVKNILTVTELLMKIFQITLWNLYTVNSIH